MQSAIRSIVEIYARCGNRRALDDLMAHRRKLIAGLRALTGPYDTSKVIAQIEDEIAVIDAGLVKLNRSAAA